MPGHAGQPGKVGAPGPKGYAVSKLYIFFRVIILKLINLIVKFTNQGSIGFPGNPGAPGTAGAKASLKKNIITVILIVKIFINREHKDLVAKKESRVILENKFEAFNYQNSRELTLNTLLNLIFSGSTRFSR